MAKIETAVQREEKIRALARRVTTCCEAFYDRATEEQRDQIWTMLDALEAALEGFRGHETPWDGTLIDVTIKVGDVKCKAQEISTWDSVMEKARDIFAFISTN